MEGHLPLDSGMRAKVPAHPFTAGESLDFNSGFYYNRARWMDPDVGSFAEADPFAGRILSATTLHKYLYANEDPSNLIDPTGRVTFGAVVGVLVGLYIVASMVANIAGLYRTFQSRRPITIRTQVLVLSDSGWTEEEAAASTASASSLWSQLAGISVIPTSIRTIPSDTRLRVVTKYTTAPAIDAIEELAPTERHVTVFVWSAGLGDAGTSSFGRVLDTGRAYSFVSGAFWVPRSTAVAHEWGHSFHLHDGWIAFNLMNALPYGPNLTSEQIEEARRYARTY